MRKVVVLAAAVVAALGVTASSATSAASETGVTARTIKIGGTFPLTGPASLYAPIPASMKAYFSYINSRKGPDGKRGIYGRQIVFNFYDDGYNPAQTVQQTRKLVEEDKVFAVVGSLGTEHNEAIRPYLNAQKVPQILNATGASTWGRGREAVPVDRRLAARLRVRGPDLRPGDRAEQPEREDRGALPERQLRAGLPPRPQGGSRGQGVEHRRPRRPYEVTAADVRAAGGQAAWQRGVGLRDLRDSEVHRAGVRDRKRAPLVTGSDLHELGLRDRHVPDAREELGRRRSPGSDVHDPVREGSGEPGQGQRRCDEALQPGDGQVPAGCTRHRRPQLLRRRRRPRLRRS